MRKIENVVVLNLGTQAQTVCVQSLACLVQNNGQSAVYFKEKRFDGVDAAADNGYRLGPGEATSVPLTALDLSLVSDSGTNDVRVLVLDEYG